MAQLNKRLRTENEYAVTANEIGSLIHHLVTHKFVFDIKRPELKQFIEFISSLFKDKKGNLG